ncbi:MAG: SMP-30/gluconolactonase/LRE family protein [Sphingomonadales bacterium]|nr:SMP-30/gluconolactonase/LRE family protein [Sphingomonadales bacterium]
MGEDGAGAFTRIASGLYLEGLACDAAREVVWYSDVIGGGIHGVKPDGTAVASFNAERRWTGGVMVNADGKVLSSGEGGIMWNDPESGKSGWLIEAIDGAPINGINEMVPDGSGGLYFGTVDLERIICGEPPRPAALYRLAADRRLTRLADGLGFANGLIVDAARRRLYCNETFSATLAFTIAADGTLADRRRFHVKEDVDGLALDAAGNLWITGFRSGFFERVAPDGTVLPRIETPAGAITQLRFGGRDARDMFFTAVPVDGGDTLKEGGAITRADSHLYHGRAPVPGAIMPPVAFALP